MATTADIAIKASMSVQKQTSNDSPTTALPKADIGVNQLGDKVVKSKLYVGATDIIIDLNGIAAIGWCWFQNLLVPATPPRAAPVITQGGTPGAVSYTYLIVANFPDGSKSVGLPVTTLVGAATLNGTNYNILTWPAVAGASTYDIYRTASGGTPSTVGKIATSTSPYNDQGAAGDGATVPPEIISNFPIGIGLVSGTYPNWIWAAEYYPVRWNGAAIHVKSLGAAPPVAGGSNLQFIIAEQ
jgi:hypothetical protein